MTVLVFDLGAGTTDVSVVSIDHDDDRDGLYDFKVLSTAGDTRLGGEDFDNRLVDYCIEEFRHTHNKDWAPTDGDKRLLKSACEDAKIRLSLDDCYETDLTVPVQCDNINFELTLRRARFEALNADLFEKTLEPVQKALRDSKLSKDQIDQVIMVGGSSRIPKIKSLIGDFFGEGKLNYSVNADEAVACGAGNNIFIGRISLFQDNSCTSMYLYCLLEIGVF